MGDIKRSLHSLAVIVFAVLMSSAAWAQEEKDEANPDRFMLRLGGYNVMDSENIIRVDNNRVPVGVYVNFEETLGGEVTGTVFRLDSRFRFTDHHALAFSWYNIKFDGDRAIDKEFNWGDTDYQVGWRVESKLEFNVYKLNYQYSLFHNDEVELGVLGGFHVMKMAISLKQDVTNESEASDITAPLPVVGLFAEYSFFRDLSAYYNYQIFAINYEDAIKGSMQDFILGLEYRAFSHVALGAAFNKYSLGIKFKDTDQTTYMDSSWSGVMLYGTLYF